MNTENLNKLYRVYGVLKQDGSLSEEQNVIYQIGKFFDYCGQEVKSKAFLANIDKKVVDAFKIVGAKKYATCIESFLADLTNKENKSNDKDAYFQKNQKLLADIDKLLAEDNLFDNYVNKYIEKHNLQQDASFFAISQEMSAARAEDARKLKTKRNIFIAVWVVALVVIGLPMISALVMYDEDGTVVMVTPTILSYLSLIVGIAAIWVLNKFAVNRIKRSNVRLWVNIALVFGVTLLVSLINPVAALVVLLFGAGLIGFFYYKDHIDSLVKDFKSKETFADVYNKQNKQQTAEEQA